MQANRKSGLTLVEIMVVIIVIGLIAMIAVPTLIRAREVSQNTRFMNDMRLFSGAIETYSLATGEYPEDTNPGVIPTGLDAYVKVDKWLSKSPIGGLWDLVTDDSGDVVAAVGVDGFTVSQRQIAKFDSRFDDGDLSAGKFRMLTEDRYYYIIEE